MSKVAANSKKTAPGRPFEKGRSGNPSGRPKEDPELKAICRAHTKVAVERLIYWMGTDNPKASVSACKEILDRAWGKPSQDVNLDAGGNITVQILNLIGQHPSAPSHLKQVEHGRA